MKKHYVKYKGRVYRAVDSDKIMGDPKKWGEDTKKVNELDSKRHSEVIKEVIAETERYLRNLTKVSKKANDYYLEIVKQYPGHVPDLLSSLLTDLSPAKRGKMPTRALHFV